MASTTSSSASTKASEHRNIPCITKAMRKPTGFEENYAEGPISPNEFEENQQLYDPDSPFSERIENAIQRFKEKKRMHEIYAKTFNKWMKYGGVEQRSLFGGVGKRELEEMDAYERTRQLATHFVSDDHDNPEKWIVDFEGVAKGFLSSQLPLILGEYTDQEVHRSCQVLRTFYNYILHHNVCPEYATDIHAACNVCNLAATELPKVRDAAAAFPGAFNIACSAIFGGAWMGRYTGDQEWAEGDRGLGFSPAEARIAYRTGIVSAATDEQLEPFLSGGVSVVERGVQGLEVMRAVQPTDDVVEHIKKHNELYSHKMPLRPLGKLVCKPWSIPSFQARGRRKSLRPDLASPAAYEFLIEDDIVHNCFVGMKFEARIRQLVAGEDVPGIWVIDDVYDVHCSFYELLLNELCLNPALTREVRYLELKGVENNEEGPGEPEEMVEHM